MESLQTRDRQVFNTEKLENGITTHHYPTEQPFAMFYIKIPVGSIHNGEDLVYGLSHFFEHIALLRSKLHPEKNSFQTWVHSKGGYINAVTTPLYTGFFVHIPVEYAESAWEGLYSQVFEAVINEKDFEKERGIIKNERKMQKWRPGTSEISHYLWSVWMHTEEVSTRQVFGDDGDLEKITKEDLEELHKYYFSSNVSVVIGGPMNIDKVQQDLSALKTEAFEIPKKCSVVEWGKQKYHEERFNDAEIPTYFIGVLHDSLSNQERVALNFFLELLTNTHSGVLSTWLRHEKGWSYGLDFTRETHKDTGAFFIDIPLQDVQQVSQVREELDTRIVKALTDEKLLSAEVERQLGSDVFEYQTLEGILEDALYDLTHYGAILSEKESRSYKKLCADPDYMQQIYSKYFAPELRGEVCILPK